MAYSSERTQPPLRRPGFDSCTYHDSDYAHHEAQYVWPFEEKLAMVRGMLGKAGLASPETVAAWREHAEALGSFRDDRATQAHVAYHRESASGNGHEALNRQDVRTAALLHERMEVEFSLDGWTPADENEQLPVASLEPIDGEGSRPAELRCA